MIGWKKAVSDLDM